MSDYKEAIISRFHGDWQSFYRVFLPELKRDRTDKRWMAKCPFHAEKGASFKIDNERGLYKCWGCGKQGDWAHFYGKQKGLDTRRDFAQILGGICRDFNLDGRRLYTPSGHDRPKRTPPADEKEQSVKQQAREEPKGEPVAIYPYVDANGSLLFEVCRYLPKTFRQRRPRKDGKGYIWNLDGVPKVLYNLPKVLSTQEVWLPEGEKDCDNLSRLGYVATCNPGGAGKWDDSYTETLRGRDVIIVPHNDDPGADHARKACRALHNVASSVRILRLPNLPAGGDVSDFIEAVGDHKRAAERLAILAGDTRPWHPIDDNPLLVQCVDDLLAEEIPDNWLVEGLISAEECGFIAGGPKWGKSIFAQNLAICMAAGHDFLTTFPIVRPLKVLYVNAEISKKNFQRRFQTMKDNAGFAYPRENLIHLTRKGFKLDNPENFQAFEGQIAYHRPDVVVLDCLYMIVKMSLDKHDTTSVFLEHISKIIEKYHCTVIIIHHYRKPSAERAQTAGAEEMIGSFALHGYGDFYLTFKQNHNNRKEITLDFEMRNAEEPQKLRILRNPETLWYELVATVTPNTSSRSGSIHDVTKILASKDMERPELLTALRETLGVKDRAAEQLVEMAHDAGLITIRLPRTRPVVYGMKDL